MRFSLRHLLFAVAIAAGVAWSISLGISRASHNIEANRTTYAARLVAQMCVEHMKVNSHTWPKNWGDLRDDFAPCLARSGQSWTFADLEDRVGVDWNVDIAELLSGSHSTAIIWVANDPDFSFYGTKPDDIVTRYLKSAEASGGQRRSMQTPKAAGNMNP